MAEPVIISYARGLLKEFPGVPEGIVDVIPVDLVVAAIIAVAADGPASTPTPASRAQSRRWRPARPTRCSTAGWSTSSATWFTEHPLYDADGQPIVVPEWSFPGRGRVQGQLQRAKTWLERAEKVLSSLPLRGKQAELSGHRRGAARARPSGPSATSSSTAPTPSARPSTASTACSPCGTASTPTTRPTFGFDPRVDRLDHYVPEIHLPSVVEHARVRTTPGGRTGETRAERLRRQVLAPERHLAAFDLENTLIASNVVASYSWLATRRLPRDDAPALRGPDRWPRRPSLLALDRKDRSDFLRFFYRRYEDAPVDQIRRGRGRDVQRS